VGLHARLMLSERLKPDPARIMSPNHPTKRELNLGSSCSLFYPAARALTRRKLFYFLHRRLLYKSEKGFEGQSLNLNEFARRALCVPILFLSLAAHAA
jgi:hypothetical protein